VSQSPFCMPIHRRIRRRSTLPHSGRGRQLHSRMRGAHRRSSLPDLKIVLELDIIIASCGRPAMCLSDNGTELIDVSDRSTCSKLAGLAADRPAQPV